MYCPEAPLILSLSLNTITALASLKIGVGYEKVESNHGDGIVVLQVKPLRVMLTSHIQVPVQ